MTSKLRLSAFVALLCCSCLAPLGVPSLEQVERWVRERSRASEPALGVTLLRTDAWGRYISSFHFVSPEFDSVPAGKTFSFEAGAKGLLPIADIDETGTLVVWWDVCEWNHLEDSVCLANVEMIVRHELRHYRQWRSIAGAAMRAASGSSSTPDPTSISELMRVPGAVTAFLRIWNDGHHYQCREVEAHVADIPPGSKGNFGLLEFYARGCASSKWAAGFSDALRQVQAITGGNRGPN